MKLKIIIVLVLATILAAIYSFFPDDSRKAQDVELSPQTAQMASVAANAGEAEDSLKATETRTTGKEIVEEEIKPLTPFKHDQTTSAPSEAKAEDRDLPARQAALPDTREESQAVAPAPEATDKPQEQPVVTASVNAPASIDAVADSGETRPASEIFPQKPDRSEIRELQGYLTNLGYPVGAIDGLLGPKTYGAIMEFQSDLGMTEIISIPKLIALLEIYQKVVFHYPTWKRIFQSQRFKEWVASKAAPVSQNYVKTLRTGPEDEIIGIINQYFQET